MLRDLRQARRWPWVLLAIIGFLGVTGWWWSPPAIRAIGQFLRADLAVKDSASSVISMIIGIVSLLTSTSLGWLQLRRAQEDAVVSSLPPGAQREREAIDRLLVHLGRLDDLPSMGEADALALRVHPAIDLPPMDPFLTDRQTSVDPEPGSQSPMTRRRAHQHLDGNRLNQDLPTFVRRDKFDDLCDLLRQARGDGGFLLLVGDSSVGKTRLLYEAAREVLPDFTVLAPDLGDGELVNKIAEARFPLPAMIVWLDELQRFLPGPYLATGHTPISAAAVRRLLEAPTPVVLLGTLWPEYARQLRTTELDPATGVHRPSYPAALDVLDDWRLQELPLLSFSDSERKAAARLAAQDPRLVEAIANHDYNVTEVLAGAREIIRRYERATKEQQAVLHVAVDARRLGIQAPLTESLLRDAALAHLTSHHPDDIWFKQALDELTATNRPQDRATAPLIPITSIDRRSVLGYTVADYLLQRLTRQRCDQRLPAVAWQAFVIHTPNRDDRLRLADSAVDQRMYDHAEALYQYLVNTGDGDWQAAYKLVGLLAMQGRIDGLRALANTGQWYAADRLAYLLIDQGRVEEAIEILRTHADAGNMPAAYKLVHILVEQGHGDEAILVLRARASTGDQYARRRLPEVLAQLGRADEAMEILRARADAGEWFATYQLRYLSTNQTHSG